jgi:hypothetical protein
MSVRKLYIDEYINPDEWIDSNKKLVMDTIYENVFSFADSGADECVILTIVQNVSGKRRYGKQKPKPVEIDVLLIRNELNTTLNVLLDFMVDIEEYEKCSEIHKLIQKINS